MSTKHLIAYAAIVAGGLGAFNRYQASSGTTSPTIGIASLTGTFDPAAAILGLQTTSTTLDMGMLADLALIAFGLYLLY